ncbi:hypothetical protein OS493_030778 [Desmophyllum pertusum]|uniref:Protein kinase domain-containing protein n=1 Tax=Desmophyllum pertusum TaxID=174260 RepID=A0A9X0CRC0_9CNID|nr:hypothetical protein OS493_030778 [Desmophyllum pertusum]
MTRCVKTAYSTKGDDKVVTYYKGCAKTDECTETAEKPFVECCSDVMCNKGISARSRREIIPFDRWELLPDQIEYGEELGRGAFGVVYKATLKKRQGIEVFDTRKGLQPSKADQEASDLEDKNQSSTDPASLMEGSSSNNDGEMSAVNIAYENYLAEKDFVHRDLAARNILVGRDNRVKVSDFGLMRQIYEDVYSAKKTKKLPLKWMAPESINDSIFTIKSDV